MAGNASTRLDLPFLDSGQAQKEVAHNEALALLDIAVQAQVEAVGTDVPPGAPADGACWVVGSAPAGDWTGRAGAIAGWTAGGWRFVAPREGLRVWDAEERRWAVFTAGAWEHGVLRGERVVLDGQQVLGARGAAIAAPDGGATIDAEARQAIAAILAALRGHGLIAA